MTTELTPRRIIWMIEGAKNLPDSADCYSYILTSVIPQLTRPEKLQIYAHINARLQSFENSTKSRKHLDILNSLLDKLSN